MASLVEQALVELQVVVRGMEKRLTGMERRAAQGKEAASIPTPPSGVLANQPPAPTDNPPSSATIKSMQATPIAPAELSTGRGIEKATSAARPVPPEPVTTKAPPEDDLGVPEDFSPSDTHAGNAAPAPRLPPPWALEDKKAAAKERRKALAATWEESWADAWVQRGPSAQALEDTIGKSVASWVGALIVLGGVLFFLKYAWDKGWLYLSPDARVALALAAGGLLVAGGQWLHWKKMPVLAAAIAGCGVAVLMAALFAGNVSFAVPVIERGTAFIGVLGVGMLGIALALQMRVEALAVLAQIGMYVSPLILNSGEDRSLVLLLHVLLVTAFGQVVICLMRRWTAVRTAAYIGAWGWLFWWTIEGPVEAHPELGMMVIAGFFLLFLAELSGNLAGRMGKQPVVQLPAGDESAPPITWGGVAAALSVANTTLTLVLLGVLFDQTHMTGLWRVSLSLAGIMTVLALLTSSKPLSMAAGIQAVGLVILAVPQYFDQLAITAAWAVLGLVLAVYARARNSQAARGWMAVLLLLVTLRVMLLDSIDRTLAQPVIALGTESVTAWMAAAWCAALWTALLVWLNAEELVTRPDGTTFVRGAGWAVIIAAVAGSLMACTADVVGLHSVSALTLAMVVWTWIVIGLARLMRREECALPLQVLADLLLFGLGCKWALHDGFGVGTQSAGLPTGIPVVNFFVLNGILMAAAALANRRVRPLPRTTAAWWIGILAFVALNVETLRAVEYFMGSAREIAEIGNPWIVKNVSLSLLWALVGFVMMLAGFAKRASPVRWAALILLGVTVVKVLIIDMANVETLLRVLSFLVVGGLLLVVSYMYHKGLASTDGPLPRALQVAAEGKAK